MRIPLLSDLADLLRNLLRHRRLVLALTREELLRPFAGSIVGLAWAVLHPLAIMLLYLVVFAVVFRVRLGPMAETHDYAVYLVAGLLSWMAWASVLTGSCQTIVGNANLVRQAHFPAEVLPVRTVLVSLVPQCVGIVVILLYSVLRFRTVFWTYLLLPAAILLQGLAMLGVAYLLAATSVFIRDVKEVATVFVTMGIYLVPAFYTPGMIDGLHPALRTLLQANPFAFFINIYRDCLVWGDIRHSWSWIIVAITALVLPGVSHRIFHRMRTFFGNYL